MNEASRRGVLLDTCAVIWLANGSPMAAGALDAILRAGLADGMFVSPVSAWDVGLLARPPQAQPLRFLPDPKAWFARVMAAPGIRPAAQAAEVAIDSAPLPGTPHGDPADRLIISTARHLGLPIVTRDARIDADGREGHVRVIPC